MGEAEVLRAEMFRGENLWNHVWCLWSDKRWLDWVLEYKTERKLELAIKEANCCCRGEATKLGNSQQEWATQAEPFEVNSNLRFTQQRWDMVCIVSLSALSIEGEVWESIAYKDLRQKKECIETEIKLATGRHFYSKDEPRFLSQVYQRHLTHLELLKSRVSRNGCCLLIERTVDCPS